VWGVSGVQGDAGAAMRRVFEFQLALDPFAVAAFGQKHSVTSVGSALYRQGAWKPHPEVDRWLIRPTSLCVDRATRSRDLGTPGFRPQNGTHG
jgi:hypothetical protein